MTDEAAPTDPPDPPGSPDASDASNASNANAAPVRKKRIKDDLRVAKYTGPQPPPPVAIFRAHSVPRGSVSDDPAAGDPAPGALIWGDADDDAEKLLLPAGPAGEAEICLGRADPKSARACVEDAAGVPADVVRAVRARASLMGGNVDEAKQEIGADRDAPAFAVADAALSLAEGDPQRAARRVADALFENPNGLAEKYLFALVKVAEGDMNEATVALAEVARSAPAHAVARYQLGQILLATGDPARAGTLFEMAWQLQPTFVAPALALAEMLAESRQYGEALNLVGNIVDVAPDALAPRALQLRVLLEVGERDAALQLSSLLHQRVPQDVDIALLHAEALAECDKPAEAKVVLDGLLAAASEPAVQQRARRQLARLALSERPPRAADAVVLFKEAAKGGGALVGELCIEMFHVCIAVGRRADAEEALEMLAGAADVGSLISGAILARSHAMWGQARKLGELARSHVAGSSAEAQLEGFLATLP